MTPSTSPSGPASGAAVRPRTAALRSALQGAQQRPRLHARRRAAAPQGRIAVCSPHFDDAILSCWSVLARDAGCVVVNVFTGGPRPGFTAWYDQKTGAASSAGHMQARALEDRYALSAAGKTPVNLGLLEAQYRLRQDAWLHTALRRIPPLRAVLGLPLLEPVLCAVRLPDPGQLADAICAAVPGITGAYVPAGIGGHPDHLAVRAAGAVLAARGLDVRLYADQPYAIWHGWPAWIGTRGERQPDRAGAWWSRHVGALPIDVIQDATVVRLTPQETDRKAAAIRRYATQIRSLSAGQGRRWIANEGGALRYEVQWTLAGPARTAAAARVASTTR